MPLSAPLASHHRLQIWVIFCRYASALAPGNVTLFSDVPSPLPARSKSASFCRSRGGATERSKSAKSGCKQVHRRSHPIGGCVRPKTGPSNNVAKASLVTLWTARRRASVKLDASVMLVREGCDAALSTLNITDGSAKRNSEVQAFAVPDARCHLAVLGRVGDAVCVEHVLVRMHWLRRALALVSSQDCRPPAHPDDPA